MVRENKSETKHPLIISCAFDLENGQIVCFWFSRNPKIRNINKSQNSYGVYALLHKHLFGMTCFPKFRY